MSSNSIGSILGGGIGFIVGGPTGAKWGFMLGGMLAGVIDPQKIKGPRLTDATRQTSMEGIPIPWGYGTFPTTGNIIFSGPLVEHEHEDNGKGGPVTVSYTYTRSYAIGICEGPISGIQQIKRNGKLVYDISPTSEILGENSKFLEKCTIYLGDETQTVDPTIEAIVGVGETGPYRGLAYIVLEDDDLTESQGAISQYEFVVQMCGTITEDPGLSISDTASFYYPLQGGYADVKGLLGDLVPDGTVGFGGVGLEVPYPPGGGNASLLQGSGVGGAPSWTIGCKCQAQDIGTGTGINFAGSYLNFIAGTHTWCIQMRDDWIPFVSVNGGGGAGDELHAPFTVSPGQTFVVVMRRTPGLLELFFDGGLVATRSASGSTISTSGQFTVGGSIQANHSVGHVWGVTSALSDSEIRYLTNTLGVDTGLREVPDAPGVWVDEDGNVLTQFSESQSLSTCAAILSDIVDDLCFRSGIDVATEVDTSQLTDIVAGFKCATESGADQFIESLTISHFFDRAEWDKKLRFPKRGGAVVAALTIDDLVFRDGPVIEQTRIHEAELLRKVNVLSIDPSAEYNVTKQTWERRAGTIKAVGEASVEIPEVMFTDPAAQVAEIRGKIAWAETDKFKFGYSVRWSKLTPTDPITLTDRAGITHRIRLQDVEEELGRFDVGEAIKDRASVYVGTATGVTNTNSPGTTSPGLKGPTLFAAMNLPQMRSQDGSGLWVGMAGMLPGWSGAQLLMSVDGGVSYSAVLTVTTPTKMGFLTADLDALGSASEPLSVHIYGGTLASATAPQVAQGANYSAVESSHGTAGTLAEVLAYQTANETATGYYDLSTLTRAIKGTTRDDHFEGDVFMDIATAHFLPISTAYVGQTLYFKAVALGVSSDSVDAVPVYYEGQTTIIDGGLIT